MRKNFDVEQTFIVCLFFFFFAKTAPAQEALPADYQIDQYLPLLVEKKVGLVTNHSAVIGSTHLVDTLFALGVNIAAIFTPEHGFWGTAPDGEHIDHSTYKGIPVISLYGKNYKPSFAQIKKLDVVVYDIQDVGVRFYTYISTLAYVMEVCAKAQVPLIVLDRPNPNGHYVDGFVLDLKFRSFVGMLPIPIVYGMTVGELAMMIQGERWMPGVENLSLTVIPCKGYTHATRYKPPIKPSPNLASYRAIMLYPTVGLLEGTQLSVGRGTVRPFEVVGHPDMSGDTSFVPQSILGMSTHPPFLNQTCYGYSLLNLARQLEEKPKLYIELLIDLYKQWQAMGKGEQFFRATFFDKLAGTDKLRKMIQLGKTADEIRQSWKKELDDFMQKRKQYLLYPDVEIKK